jgi:hypothetical protein
MSKEEKEMVIPDQIYDNNSKKSYIKGRYFGKVSVIPLGYVQGFLKAPGPL